MGEIKYILKQALKVTYTVEFWPPGARESEKTKEPRPPTFATAQHHDSSTHANFHSNKEHGKPTAK
jgi:hypothetical protein